MFCQFPHLQCLALTIFSLDFQSSAEPRIVLPSLISLEMAFSCVMDASTVLRLVSFSLPTLQSIMLHNGGAGAEFETLIRSLV